MNIQCNENCPEIFHHYGVAPHDMNTKYPTLKKQRYDSSATYSFGMIVLHCGKLWIFDKKKFINRDEFQRFSINDEPKEDSEIWRVLDKLK